jgi:hypothetical protein
MTKGRYDLGSQQNIEGSMVRKHLKVTYCSVILLSLLHSATSLAGAREQAIKMYNRVAGVPPSKAILDEMVTLIDAGKPEEAAILATDDANFYNLTLKNMVTPWTNEEMNVHADLNDYSATVIGMVRDNVPFDQLLYADIMYVGDEEKMTAALNSRAPFVPYSLINNRHYEQIKNLGLSLKDTLVRASQIEYNEELANQSAYVPAGVYTTRAFAAAYYSAGTNRAAFRFTLKTFFCEDNEAFHDINLEETWIRKDVDRNPAGDPKQFVNKCKGCHTGMDSLAGAFAYVDFIPEDQGARLSYTRPIAGSSDQVFAAAVVSKYSNNDQTFPNGHLTSNDGWKNLWTDGPNKRIGWNMAGKEVLEGFGLKSFGRMISETNQFRQCMTKKVYRQVCMRDPSDQAEKDFLDATAKRFGGEMAFNMKKLFASTAAFCSMD